MPSNKVPGAVETAANGNAGDKSLTNKVSNSSAENTRGINASGKTKDQSRLSTQTTVRTGAVGAAQETSVEEGEFGGSVRDRYRNSGATEVPSRQLGELAEDSPAALSVVAYNGETRLSAYSRFFLMSVSEAETEKYNIVETFSAYYTFFFGKRPPMYRYSGVLLNDPEQNWMNDFRFLYENFFRGTAAAELDAQVFMTYDKRVVSGFLLGLTIQQEAQTDKGVPFSIDMLVVDHQLVGFSSDFEGFRQKQIELLNDLRRRAEEESARLNSNPDSRQVTLKNIALNGRINMSTVTKSTEKPKVTPPSQQGGPEGERSNGLISEAVDPSSKTYAPELTSQVRTSGSPSPVPAPVTSSPSILQQIQLFGR